MACRAVVTRRTGWLTDDPSAQIALVGDWNIAPTDEDVWSAEFLREQHARHTTRNARRSTRIVDAQFADVVRPFTPGPAGVHLLGLHAAARFRRTAGMRIDFILGSRPLASASRTPRSCARSAKARHRSDHAPVLVELS